LTAIDAWCAVAGITRGPLFLPVGGGPKRQAIAHATNPKNTPAPPPQLTPEQIGRILSKHAERANIHGAARITGHSARVGSAIDLIEAGFSVTEVMFAGGWKSPRMVLHYAKRAKAGLNAMAQFRAREEEMSGDES
jgi:integrase